jgi:cytochrome c oxidase assembly factor CtaG
VSTGSSAGSARVGVAAPADGAGRSRARSGVPGGPVVIAGGVLLAGSTGVALALLAPSVATLYGLPDPGTAVEAALPAARVVAALSTAAVLAQLLIAVVLAPGDPDDVVSAAGYAGLRRMPRWAAVQTAAYLVAGWLSLVENSGLGPGRLLGDWSAVLNGAQQLEPVSGWLLSALLAAAVGVAGTWVLSWRSAAGLLVAALAVPLPMALTSATDAQRSHDIAGDALTLHVLAALLWLGSALAVGTLARHGDPGQAVWRRHGVITAWTLPVVVLSGVVSSAYAVAPGDLFTSGYGRLVLASALATVLLVLLVVLAGRLRGAVRRAGGGAVRLLLLEVSLLGLAAALGTGLTRVIPPAQLGIATSRMVYLLGYDLPGPLDPAALLLHWRPDLVFGPLAVLGAVGYLLGVRRLRHAGRDWPVTCTAAWLAGCLCLLLSTCSGLATYAPAMFSLHMIQHMLLATLVPVLLVLGHGVSLALDSAPAGVARALGSLLHSPVLRSVRNPFVAWVAVGLTLFGLYPTGLYADVLQQHWGHLGMSVAFLGTGLAIFWAVLGRSPGRAPLPPIGQIVMVFALMALHAGFSAWLLSQPAPLAGDFYTALHLPWVPDVLADQRRGAVIGWALAEAPVILAVLALVLRWTHQDRTPTPSS